MRIDVRDPGLVASKVWLDGRRVEDLVEMADDRRGEVRFTQLGGGLPYPIETQGDVHIEVEPCQ